MIDSPTDFVVPPRRTHTDAGTRLESSGGNGSSLCTLVGGILGCVYASGLSVDSSRASRVAEAIVRGVWGNEIPRAEHGLGVWLEDREEEGLREVSCGLGRPKTS